MAKILNLIGPLKMANSEKCSCVSIEMHISKPLVSKVMIRNRIQRVEYASVVLFALLMVVWDAKTLIV